MVRSTFTVAFVAACIGCTQSSAPSTSPSVATELSAEQTEAAPAAAEPAASAEPVASAPKAEAKPAAEQTAATTQPRTAAKPVVADYSPNVPAVMMSVAECADCKVNVGDQLPAIKLPKLEGGDADLASLAGKQATVVLFWGADRWMSQTALTDLQRDVAASPQGESVAVVGVAVGQKPDAVSAAIEKSAARFPQLIDADGKASAQLGATALPRVYVLDAAGKVAWFDVEYSEATRRELHDTLAALTKG